MGSLEESRRANMAITAERDHYKEFWTAMNNYHSVMSRFQVSAPSVGSLGFAGAPFPGQMDYSSPPSIPQLGTAPSPLIPQTGAPPFATSAYPVYSATAANLAATVDLKFQPQYQTAGAPPPPAAHDGATRDPAPSTPEPTGPATAKPPSQSPETPSKRTSIKSIESYFASARKTSFPLSVETPAVPAIPKPSPPHEIGIQFSEGNKERKSPPPGIPSKYSVDLSSSTEEASLSPLENEGQGQEGQGQEGPKVGDHQSDWLV